MSYRQQYTGYVHYSGTVSYPASQSGGTMGYSGSEPVYITIEVDTDAFDASVSGCNKSVNGLTTAVVATEAAQIAAKQKASEEISTSLINGFFQYVGADLSQKIKELASKCESLFFSLLGYQENCHSKSKQMQTDYHRITKRYAKIFDDLDKETISRIEQIDSATFQFANAAQQAVDRKINSELLGISTIAAHENLRLESLLSCSHIKQRAYSLLNKANNYLQGGYKLEHSLQDLFEDVHQEGEVLVPVVYVESIAEKDRKESMLYGTQGTYEPMGGEMKTRLLSCFQSDAIEWEDIPTDDFDKVRSYMNAGIQAGSMDDRTLKTMLQLLDQQGVQTIKS